MKLGTKLKELRQSNNFTQQQVADATGLSHSAISQYEHNAIEPTAGILAKLAVLYGVSADYLLDLEDDLGNKTVDLIQNAVTSEERKILTAYRTLSPTNKLMILRMLNIE